MGNRHLAYNCTTKPATLKNLFQNPHLDLTAENSTLSSGRLDLLAQVSIINSDLFLAEERCIKRDLSQIRFHCS